MPPDTFAKLPVRALINDPKILFQKKVYVTIPQWFETFPNMSDLRSGLNRAKCGLALKDPIDWFKLRLNQPKMAKFLVHTHYTSKFWALSSFFWAKKSMTVKNKCCYIWAWFVWSRSAKDFYFWNQIKPNCPVKHQLEWTPHNLIRWSCSLPWVWSLTRFVPSTSEACWSSIPSPSDTVPLHTDPLQHQTSVRSYKG